MGEYPIDTRRIPNNPFSFKTDKQEADNTLRTELAIMSKFFESEISEEGQVEATWTHYQEANGPNAVFRVASAINHVLGVQSELAAIAKCQTSHEVSWFGSIVLLLHVGLIELIEGITHVNFAAWAIRRTEDDRPLLPEDATPEAVRKYLTVLRERYEEDHGTARRLARALEKGLSVDEKSRLLLAYTFSEPYQLGESRDPWNRMHLHCRARKKKWEEERQRDGKKMGYPWAAYCTPFCSSPTVQEVQELLPKLAKNYLYVMRNQLVHAASAVMIAATPPKIEEPLGRFGYSLADVFFKDDQHLISYGVTLSVAEVAGLLRRCAWNRLRGVDHSGLLTSSS